MLLNSSFDSVSIDTPLSQPPFLFLAIWIFSPLPLYQLTSGLLLLLLHLSDASVRVYVTWAS